MVSKLTKIGEGKSTTGIRDLDGSVVLRSNTSIKDRDSFIAMGYYILPKIKENLPQQLRNYKA